MLHVHLARERFVPGGTVVHAHQPLPTHHSHLPPFFFSFLFFLRYVEVRPNNTDVEVVLANAYICLPESQWDGDTNASAVANALAGAGTGTGGGGSGAGVGPAVVAHADVTLTQQWRGMPQV